jgi:hypothetical protein
VIQHLNKVTATSPAVTAAKMIAANSWLHTKNPVRLLQFIIYEIVLIQTSLFFSINLNETVNLCDLDYSFGKSSDDNKGMYVVEMLASARIW